MDSETGKADAHNFRMRLLWLTVSWALVILVIVLSLIPTPIQVPGAESDKFAHALAYAALMGVFASLYETSSSRMGLAAALVALGVALEFVQGWSGIRHFDVADMLANAIGVAIGWLLAPPRLPNFFQLFEKLFSVAASRRNT